MKKICGNCKHFRSDYYWGNWGIDSKKKLGLGGLVVWVDREYHHGSGDPGLCTFNPPNPKLQREDIFTHGHPTTRKIDSCGQWQMRENPDA